MHLEQTFKKWTRLNRLQCLMEINAVREQKNQSCMSNKTSMWSQVITNPIEIPLGGIAKSKTAWNIWNNSPLVDYLFIGSVSSWKPFKNWWIYLDNGKHLNPKLFYSKKPRDRAKERMRHLRKQFKETILKQNREKTFLVLTDISPLQSIAIFWFGYGTEQALD